MILDPRPHWQAISELGSLLVRRRELVWELARREVSDRYAGQALGLFWAVGHPLLLIAVYLFVFAFVFKVRVARRDDLPLDYAVYLLSGLIPWLVAQESSIKASLALVANANLVKQVVFPIELLPIKGTIAAFLPLVVSLILLIGYCAIGLGTVPATWLAVPFLVAVLLVGLTGVAFALSALGAYVRDLKDVVQAFSVIGVYLIPAFYLPSMVPELFRPILYLNPFSYMVWCFQDAIYFGAFQHPGAWVVFCTGCAASFVIGYRVFRRLKPQFGNVL